MSGPKSFFNPLDRSQISYIPNERETISDSQIAQETESDTESSSFRSFPRVSGEPLSSRDSESSHSIFSDQSHPTTSWNSIDRTDGLSSISSGSSRGTDMSHGVRYKVVLKFSQREVNLIRNSWTMMLNDDLAGDRFRSVVRQLWSDFGPASWGSSSNGPNSSVHHRKSAVPSVRSARNPSTMINTSRVGSSATSISSSGPSSLAKQQVAVTPAQSSNNSAFASSIFCRQFYGNLLYMEPAIETMFPSIRHQAVSFAGVLTMAVNNLDDLTTLEAYLSSLGKRHSRILAIEPPHFELMGMAFLKTIKDRFGYHSTLELEETWSRLYSFLANSILQFGIDPVLKVDALDNDVIFPLPEQLKPSTQAPANRFHAPAPPSSTHPPSDPSMRHSFKTEPVAKQKRASKPNETTTHAVKNTPAIPTKGTKPAVQRKAGHLPARSLYANTTKKQEQDKDCVIM
ncbi:LADA_0F01640g1_1 [Lachancea dasiensis]|uniref:LADA_0F01640g1_1 n=1 Tax=Lachancea dasiensis TaxID=1072105 RepID=A0A1G4JI23_9SACH|nr:LADA_0F01640g1_1 [Lachancea dasiensis]